jgi:hypothetical protein
MVQVAKVVQVDQVTQVIAWPAGIHGEALLSQNVNGLIWERSSFIRVSA